MQQGRAAGGTAKARRQPVKEAALRLLRRKRMQCLFDQGFGHFFRRAAHKQQAAPSGAGESAQAKLSR